MKAIESLCKNNLYNFQFQKTKSVLGYENITNTRLGEVVDILKTGHENITTPEEFFDLMHKPKLIALGRADIIQYNENKDASTDLEPKIGGIIDLKVRF